MELVLKSETGGIIDKAFAGEILTEDDILHLLVVTRENERQDIIKAAREITEREFGYRIFLYGFIYLSTFCRNICRFCYYRKPNRYSPRYRKSVDDVVKATAQLALSGVHLIDLTMGEDPFFHTDDGMDAFIDILEAVKDITDIPLMVSPGVVSDSFLRRLKQAGVHWYACYQETHSPSLFNYLRPEQSYSLRLGKKAKARKYGLLIEDGILIGVGESERDIARSIHMMMNLEVDQARVMSFVPQKGIPLSHYRPPRGLESLLIAVLRLCFPDRLIPASLDIDGLGGLKSRLESGANVVTSIIPEGSGLAGVAQSCLDIEDGRRSVHAVKQKLAEYGLAAATERDYRDWIDSRKKLCNVLDGDG